MSILREAGITVATGSAGEAGVKAAEQVLPAFLEGNELPEGYKRINLVSPAREQLIRLDEAPGSETVCYVGKVGVRLTRKEEGKVFFSFLGFDLPKIIEHYKGPGMGLSTNIGPDGIPLAENEMAVSLFNQDRYGSDEKNGLVKGDGLYNHINLFLPCTKDELGGVGSLSRLSFGISEGKIVITNNNYNDNVEIAVPVAAEAELTLAETAFMGALEDLKTIENMSGSINADAEEIRQYFQDLKLYFSGLPEAGQLRGEVMKGVFGQLGTEAERLKKAGKPETEIFDEWLMQVFIPLYRRAGKKP